jgi:TATA-binding protein-associated factor Taf7
MSPVTKNTVKQSTVRARKKTILEWEDPEPKIVEPIPEPEPQREPQTDHEEESEGEDFWDDWDIETDLIQH